MKYSDVDNNQVRLCDYSPHGVCLIHVELDDEGKPIDWTFEYCNQALAELEGFKSRDELIGKRFYELFPDGDRKWLPYYYEAAYNNRYMELDDISEEVDIYLHIEAIPTAFDGSCLCIIRDIKRAVFEKIKKNEELEQALAEEKEIQKQLKQALDAANLRNEIISSISKSYRSIYRIDLRQDFFEEISNDDETHKLTGYNGCASEKLNKFCDTKIDPEYREAVRPFLDITTLPERLKDEEHVTTEYKMCDGTWQRMRFIVKKRDESGRVTHVLCTVRSITDTKRRELDLRFATDMAKRENEMKTRFLANISHDIRTPLNGLIGMVNLAEQYADEPDKLRQIRTKTKESLKYLVSFVNDVLDMSKLQSGELKSQDLNFDLIELLFRINQNYAEQAEAKGVIYEVEWTGDNIKHQYLIGNPLYLERVLCHIADNAVKYSSAGSTIEVSMQEEVIDDDHVLATFYCKDHGTGMSKEFVEQAFDMFTQENAGSRSTYVGSGLGLAITKNLVDRMGGTIELQSEIGVGTTAIIKLPFKVGEKDAVKGITRSEDITVEGLRVLIAEDNETTSGILNDIEAVGKVAKAAGKTYIVDAMSSFAGVDIPLADWGIDFLISSANKCIQGVPGFAFIIAKRDKLMESAGKARSLSLDLYDQWKGMEEGNGKWRFTSPTHVVLAFAKAMEELDAEGGIPARHARYAANQRLLTERFVALGFRPYLEASVQGPIITTFCYPEGAKFSFKEMYDYIKERGYVLYPGKVMEADTFRVGNIGEIYAEDIEKLAVIMADFLKEVR